MRIAYGLLLIVSLIVSPVRATEPIVVITAANNSLNTLTLDTLKLVYLRKQLINESGMRWIPVNLSIQDALRRDFSLALFNLLPEEQDEYWNIQYFNGITPPKVVASEEAVLRFVVLTQGAIGYIHKQKVDKRVKVLLIIKLPTTVN